MGRSTWPAAIADVLELRVEPRSLVLTGYRCVEGDPEPGKAALLGELDDRCLVSSEADALWSKLEAQKAR